jgi:two-component system, cell cycle sensor histidine kinase and response regulator CckA
MHNETTSASQLLAELETLRKRVEDLTTAQSRQAQVAAALRESEERYRRMTQAVTDYIFTVRIENGAAVETIHGPACEAVTGYTADEFRNDPFLWIRMVHPEDAAAVERVAQQMLGGEVPGPLEHRLFRKDGRLRWVRNTLVPHFDPQGRLLSYDGLVSDITERKLAQQALEEEKQFSDALIHSLPGSFFVLDGNRRLIRWNEQFAQQLPVPPEALQDPDSALFTHEEDRALAAEKLREVREKGEAHFEARAHARSGESRPHLFRAHTTTIGGQPYIVVTGLDVTEWRRAERALREREASLASATENAPCMIYQAVWRGDGTLHFPYASAWCREKLGIEPSALRENGARLTAHVLPDDTADLVASLARSAQTLEIWNHEFCGVDKSGAVMRLNGIAKPERQSDGSIQWNGVLLDVTQRWQAEQERQRLEAQLAHAQKMESIGRLAGGVAHDFNNVLTAILGYTELELLNPEDLSPHVADSLRQIARAGERARDLTRQLLAFGRKQTLATRVLDVNEVIRTFSSMLHRLIGEDIEVKMTLARSPSMVRADGAQIEQVLLNLAVNARDAMPNGGIFTIETANVALDMTHAATHSEVSPGDYVMLSVGDTGCGMDSETLKMAFEPFFTTKAHGKGTGLGLATVYGIVKQHNGHILAASEPGIGTTIKIYLPRVSEAATRSTSPTLTALPAVPLDAATILVVEDDAAVRRLTSAMLAGLGYEVIEAESAAAAILRAGEHTRIHLLVADVIMPEMNGRQVYDKLRTIHPDLKVLFVSGYTADVIAHRGILEEGVQLLPKPFSVQALAKKVRELLAG